MKTKSTKTCFVSLQIRELTKEERKALDVVRDVLCGRVQRDVIGKILACLSIDNKDRPLVLDKLIVDKIRRDHGNIVAENLVINVHDWDFGIRNMDGNPDRINLIKMIPNSNNYIVIGAIRNNGFYMVTHYEAFPKKGSNKLKSLLGRGDLLDRSGVPSEAPSILSVESEKVSDDNNIKLLNEKLSKLKNNVNNKEANKLKRLLKREDVLDRFGRTPSDFEEIGSLHVNSFYKKQSSLERFSGVETNDRRGVPSEAPEAPLVPSMKPEKVSGDIDTKLLAKEYSKSESKVKSKDVDI
jgi:hypothetical protein